MEVYLLLLKFVVPLFLWNIKACLSDIEGNAPLEEYCEGSSFSASCRPDETIMIEQAIYGRMRTQKCITRSFGEMNCQIDVRDILDSHCSGRRTCEVRVGLIYETLTPEQRPCSHEVRSYLEASFTCVKVIKPNVEQCKRSGYSEITTAPKGYISSLMTQETNCGSYDSPWTIRLKPGLKMRITLYDFAYSTRQPVDMMVPNTCQVYAVIKEKVGEGNTPNAISKTVCGSDMRKNIVYTSNKNEVEIRVTKRDSEDVKEYFLLQYEAFGCALPPQPKYGWVKLHNGRATFGCNDTDITWSLTCGGNTWSGENRTCAGGDAAVRSVSEGKGSPFSGITSGSQWTAFIIIGCIAVTIGLVIFMIGLFYIRRKKTLMEGRTLGANSYQRPSIPDFYAQTQPGGGDPMSQSNYTTRKSFPGIEAYGPPFTNDYMRTWQMQRHHNTRHDAIETMPNIHTGQHRHTIVGQPLQPNEHHQLSNQPHHHHHQQQEPHSQIDGRPMSEHIYESPNFERKFNANDNGFEPLQRVNQQFCDDEGIDGSLAVSNRNPKFNSLHHTA